MRKFLILAAMLVLACFGFGVAAKADTIGSLTLTDCGGGVSGCPGATYSFDIGTTSATLKITINGAVGSTNDYITAVDLGFTSDANAPTGLTVTGPTTGWSASAGPVSSGGSCGGVSGAFVCASAPSLTSLPISAGNTYMWTWNYDAIDPSLISSD